MFYLLPFPETPDVRSGSSFNVHFHSQTGQKLSKRHRRLVSAQLVSLLFGTVLMQTGWGRKEGDVGLSSGKELGDRVLNSPRVC